MEYVLAALIGYGLGSIPASALVARRHGVDLHTTGDGNPGAWNALEQLGPRRAWPAFAGDGAKAFAAGLIGAALGGWWVAWAAVLAAMAGHALPLPHPRRGGKAVMCFVGGAFVLAPVAAAGCVALCGAVAWRAGFAWGARAGVFAFPVLQLLTGPVERVAATGVLMTLIGLLFAVRRRSSVPATSAPGAPPRA